MQFNQYGNPGTHISVLGSCVHRVWHEGMTHTYFCRTTCLHMDKRFSGRWARKKVAWMLPKQQLAMWQRAGDKGQEFPTGILFITHSLVTFHYILCKCNHVSKRRVHFYKWNVENTLNWKKGSGHFNYVNANSNQFQINLSKCCKLPWNFVTVVKFIENSFY